MPTPIPQPPGLPILGNLFDLKPGNTWGSFNKLAVKYRPIFKISVVGHDIVFVTSAKLLEEICDEKRFRKCVTGPIVEIRQAVHDSLFTAYHNEESWGIAHRIMAPLVSPDAVAEAFAGMRETTKDLIQKWTAGPRQRVNVCNDLDRLNHAANMLCFFDQRIHCLEGQEPSVIKAMDAATNEAMRRAARPKLLNWLIYQRRFNAYNRTMRDYAAEIVAQRRAYPTDKKDLLDALLHGKDPQTGLALTDSQHLDEIINIFIGSATSPNLVSFALYYLMKHPQEITRAREEIDGVVIDQLEHRHLASLPYCEAILRESLRLCATAPGFNIEPIPGQEEPVLLAGGEYQIPNKQPMIALLSAVNRDPEVFEEPDAFIPERMVGENYERLPAGVKKGFGNGKRQCFGTRFAWEWCFMVLVTILREVNFDLADKQYQTAVEGINYNGAFSTKPLGLFAVTGPRQRL
ncbi:putative cytochrome P450 [Aspergillus clavatus NRRL 1]|uniref:Cytochrome P450, putative n=1 Tax=Aspergillus clavatus (strain ATCC 1007 / CBS 513.65 / DSM 816 / NCTC 3887 / NRRL 1 / QM 1276 / 107) TaxID=344612 RepID=A1C576_ASPCL|nr:cytochrome P450, putative [Aspergillus clavatus NRRL 1]EAW14844.1 cytochrome P450, putative [Aspergillus clavatus NRRL 1]